MCMYSLSLSLSLSFHTLSLTFFVLLHVGHVSLIEQMSERQFVDWLRDKGMSRSEDRDKVIGMFSLIVIVFMCVCFN